MLWLDAVRGLAAERVATQRERWSRNGGGIHAAIDDILAASGAPSGIDAAVAHDALTADDRWQTLRTALELTPRDVEWVAVLAACELDPRLTRVLGYLDDTASPAAPSPLSAALLWGWATGEWPGPASAVARWELGTPAAEWQSTTPWAMDSEIAAFLAGRDDWTDLRGEVRPLDAQDRECLHPTLVAEMAEAVRGIDGGVVIELVGRPGSGRRTLLAQLAAELDRVPLLLDPRAGVRGIRAARLLDAVGIVAAGEGETIATDAERLTLVACESAPRNADDTIRLRWDMPSASAAQRRRLWAAASVLDEPVAVAEWDLTPGEIAVAARAGAAAARVLGARVRAGSLSTMQPLPLPYSWDDLVVPDHVSDALERLLVEVRLRTDVLDDWEFRRLVPATAGITALFAGPSGTGKTMATQVLARELGLDLFRVDLATVVSKYIGETEKQLAAVFDEAERSRILVLFDEADALFGQRTKVQDAHDRYANIEIDYLLQRLDSFGGIAVLATNRKSDLDPAFLRRLRTVVDFVAPAAAERLRLWRSALPSHTSRGVPVTEELDHEWLAAHLELTGAEIKTIALGAAFDSRQADRLISLDAVLEASRRELGKRGAVLRVAPVTAGTEVAS